MSKVAACRETEPLFDRYLDHEITVADYRRLREHLSGCPRCREDWDALERSLQQVHALPQVHVSDEFMPSLLAKLPAGASVRRPWRRWMLEAAAAAAVILIIGAGSSSRYAAMVSVPGSQGPKTITAREVTVLPQNTVLSGDLTVVNGDVYLAGKVAGNVKCVGGQVRPARRVDVQERSGPERFANRIGEIARDFARGLSALFRP